MAKYRVAVQYPVQMEAQFEVEALSPSEAREKALALARDGQGDFDFDASAITKPAYEALEPEPIEGESQTIYTVRGGRSRTLYQDATAQITEAQLKAELEKMDLTLASASKDDIAIALGAILADREHDLDWTTDDAETHEIRATAVNGEKING